MKVKIYKEFSNNLIIYSKNKKSLLNQVYKLKNYIEVNGLDSNFFKNFDVKNLGNNFYRIKFIPYRIILKHIDNSEIEFLFLFKRKGDYDYKIFLKY